MGKWVYKFYDILHPQVAEAYTSLRSNINYCEFKDGNKSLTVTSALPSEGKTTLSISIAISMAKTGLKVLLVDADLHKPPSQKYLGGAESSKSGLSEYLKGFEMFEEILYPTNVASLFFVPSGLEISNPSDMIASKQFKLFLEKAEELFDRVIIDTSPLSCAIDCVDIAAETDGVILVAQCGKTRYITTQKLKEQMENARANILGIVLNKVNLGYKHKKRDSTKPSNKKKNLITLPKKRRHLYSDLKKIGSNRKTTNSQKQLSPNVLQIKSQKTERQYFKDLWSYRELFYFLAWRDILVRYKQTVIGVLWALIRPFLAIVVFTVIFGNLAKLPTNDVPYAILVVVAMLPWQFFDNALSESSNSLISNSNMISKVYFPRIIAPCSSVIVSFVDFLISFFIMIALMVWYKFVPDWKIITLPIFMLIAFFTSMGAGLWFSSLNIKYRDFRFVVPFIVRFGLYLSPVGFISSVVPEKWKLLYNLNPMVGVIDGFRWAILGNKNQIYLPGFLLSLVLVAAIFISGLMYFRKTERTFADVI